MADETKTLKSIFEAQLGKLKQSNEALRSQVRELHRIISKVEQSLLLWKVTAIALSGSLIVAAAVIACR